MCQQVQASLLPAVAVGYLTFVLVTVIPDPKETLQTSWELASARRQQLIDLARPIPNLFGFFIALETHGASKSKGKKKRKPIDQQEALYLAEMNDPELDKPEEEGVDPTGPGKLAGKAHFHLLLYYPRLCTQQYNISYYKQLVQQHMPASDVNEGALRENHRRTSAEPHFVRSCTYVLKANNCPATRRYWQKYVSPAVPPPLPEFIAGEKFGYDQQHQSVAVEESRRFLHMIKQLPDYCVTRLPLELADAPPVFGSPVQLDKKGRAMLQLANIMREHGVYVGGDNEDAFYMRHTRPDYRVECTFTLKYRSVDELNRFLTTLPAATQLVLSFGDVFPTWFRQFAQFQRLPPPKYEHVELADCVYGIRTGQYYKKSKDYVCFRAYGYTQATLTLATPREWLQLVEHICTPQLLMRRDNPENNVYSNPISMDMLLRYLAYLLRPRLPKQKVLYLWGKSNCGKTTLISFLTQLYPKEAIGFLNRSCVALSGITENIACIWADEFDVGSIPRADLLMLTDGAQHLPVRKMHQDARLIEHPRCPMVFTSNPQPKYKDDDSQALENRFEMVHCENVLVDDKRKQARIFAQHLEIVAWLNRWLQPIEEYEALERARDEQIEEEYAAYI